MNVVLDTNVLVSGLLNPHGAPARILDLVLLGKLTPLYDDRLLAEYQEVLMQSDFAFDPQKVEALLSYVKTIGRHVVAALLDVKLPDPDDRPFLEVAVTSNADALITGNIRHFVAARQHGVRVVSPSIFLAHWRTST